MARATRSPTPFDTGVEEYVEGDLFLTGNPEFRAEELVAWDAGIRFNPVARVSVTASVFYNDYDDLRTIEFGAAPTFLPLLWGNEMHGQTWGVNAWATWQVTDWWRLSPGFELMRRKLRIDAGSTTPLGTSQAGNDPRGHATLTSSMDLPHGIALFTLRTSGDALAGAGAYTEPPPVMRGAPRTRWSFGARVNLLHGGIAISASPGAREARRMAEERWSTAPCCDCVLSFALLTAVINTGAAEGIRPRREAAYVLRFAPIPCLRPRGSGQIRRRGARRCRDCKAAREHQSRPRTAAAVRGASVIVDRGPRREDSVRRPGAAAAPAWSASSRATACCSWRRGGRARGRSCDHREAETGSVRVSSDAARRAKLR